MDLAVDDLLLANHFDDVSGLEIHTDRITGVGDFMAKPFNLFEGRLKAVLENYQQ